MWKSNGLLVHVLVHFVRFSILGYVDTQDSYGKSKKRSTWFMQWFSEDYSSGELM